MMNSCVGDQHNHNKFHKKHSVVNELGLDKLSFSQQSYSSFCSLFNLLDQDVLIQKNNNSNNDGHYSTNRIHNTTLYTSLFRNELEDTKVEEQKQAEEEEEDEDSQQQLNSIENQEWDSLDTILPIGSCNNKKKKRKKDDIVVNGGGLYGLLDQIYDESDFKVLSSCIQTDNYYIDDDSDVSTEVTDEINKFSNTNNNNRDNMHTFDYTATVQPFFD